MVGIELRDDYCADDLRALARKSRDAKLARRLMELVGVANGLSKTDAVDPYRTCLDVLSASASRQPSTYRSYHR